MMVLLFIPLRLFFEWTEFCFVLSVISKKASPEKFRGLCLDTIILFTKGTQLTVFGYIIQNIGLDTMILFTKGTELTIFGQLIIQMMFSINFNLKTFRLLNCLHMIFLHCILRYLIIL